MLRSVAGSRPEETAALIDRVPPPSIGSVGKSGFVGRIRRDPGSNPPFVARYTALGAEQSRGRRWSIRLPSRERQTKEFELIKTLLFWCFVALDGAALGLLFVLGLAAAKPSHTSPLSVVAFFLLPALALAGLILLFLRAPWPMARTAAMVLAGLPVAIVAGGALVSRGVAWKMGVTMDDGLRPDAVAQRTLESAIAANDALAVARIAADRKARINEAAALVAALRQLEKTPGRLDVLRALLQAGVRPNTGGSDEPPLAVAIRASRFTGVEPVMLLLRAGADPNFSSGSQPSFFAALSTKTDPAVLRALLDHGADLRAVDMAGSNAVY